LPARIEKWSLTSLQPRLVKTGGRLVKHARYYLSVLAESHLTRRLFGSMIRTFAIAPKPDDAIPRRRRALGRGRFDPPGLRVTRLV
jgi:hypothetical protein